MDTLELKIELVPKDPWAEILVAELADAGFDSFVDTETGLIAMDNLQLIWKKY